MTSSERHRRRFSEEFRREQVALIESGQTTIAEVARLYEVTYSSVKYWVQRFGSKSLPEQVIISKKSEYDRIGELEKEVRRLKEIIGSQQVELIYKDGLLELAKGQLGSDFEKKMQ